MGSNLYSSIMPLENDNGLLNKDNMYTAKLAATVTFNGITIDTVLGAKTVVRAGTKCDVIINTTSKDFLEINEMTANGSSGTLENGCLITQIVFIGDGAGGYTTENAEGNEIDVFDVAMSLIVCSDEAGEFYFL